MKPSELRIDNWVYNEYTKKEMQVYPMMIAQLACTNDDNNIKPIKLTEEWLKKFGFKKDDIHNCFVIFQHDVIALDIEFDCYKNILTIGGFDSADDMEHMKYVHQFQNFFYALTGKELEIK